MRIMHLKEELDTQDIADLSDLKRMHLEQDMAAIYRYLTYEWCYYLNYLNRCYPSLFSTVIMLSPFNKKYQRTVLEQKETCGGHSSCLY